MKITLTFIESLSSPAYPLSINYIVTKIYRVILYDY